MFVGEAPGYWENRTGVPFSEYGKSGRLLNAYLLRNGFPRQRVFVTNLYPYWPGQGDPDPTPRQIHEQDHFLRADIKSVRPRFILALGRVATAWFRGETLALDTHHGLPFLWEEGRRYFGSDTPWVIPGFHPASALRNPENAGKCFYDIKQFSLYAKGKLRPTTTEDIIPNPVYDRKRHLVIDGVDPAVDTEGFKEDPHCISYSVRTGTGTVVMASDIRPGTLSGGMYRIILTNSPHDLPVIRAMGLELDDDGFHDTALMARLLLLEPPDLKSLALRHCGMAMREYNEVVGPHFRRACRRYFKKASRTDWGAAPVERVFDKKSGEWRTKRPHSANTRIKSVLTAIAKGDDVDLAARWLAFGPGLRLPIEKSLGPFPTNHPRLAPEDELVPYAGRDPDATRRVFGKLWPMIEVMKLKRAYFIDLHAIPMFVRMMENGIAIDQEHFKKIRPAIVKKLATDSASWLKRWNKGKYFNLNSGDELAKYLFDRLKLKPIKMTPTGKRPMVDENTLELLKDQHPSIPTYMVWKKLHTNLTFVDRIPKHVRPNGRIYAHINTQGTVTGRPSTSDPNLLNIPIRTPLGKEIRRGFIAQPGCLLLSIDLAQIELRIGAHLSQDKEMLRAFRNNEDLHEKTALSLGITRYTAKIINFGIFYGMSYLRLKSELLEQGIEKSDDDCKAIIQAWFDLYSGVRDWLEDLFARARRRGYVRGLSGRLRYVPNLYLPQGNPMRSEAERHTGNFPVQEGNAFVIKRAMWRMWKWIKAHPEAKVEPLLQIYDEILFEVPATVRMGPVRSPLIEEFRAMMIADQRLFSVPLKADVALGYRWGDL